MVLQNRDSTKINPVILDGVTTFYYGMDSLYIICGLRCCEAENCLAGINDF